VWRGWADGSLILTPSLLADHDGVDNLDVA